MTVREKFDQLVGARRDDVDDAKAIRGRLRDLAERLGRNDSRADSRLAASAATAIEDWIIDWFESQRRIASLTQRLEDAERHLARMNERRVADSLRIDLSINCRRCGGRVWAIEAGDGAGPDLLVGADGREHVCAGEGGGT